MKKLRPKDSGVFNLGSGKARSWNDLANAAFKTLDKPASIDYNDMPESLRNQYQYFTQAKMDRFKKVLPNFKFMDLEEGIADYYHNYLLKDHPYASFEG
jgi:ADP-L-glycero-D-manno-heptose 6-epimerase